MDYKRILRKTLKRVSKLEAPSAMDIGAYKGALAENLLDMNPNAKIYLIEPNLSAINGRFANNPNVTVSGLAISNYAYQTFYSGDKSRLSDSLFPKHLEGKAGKVASAKTACVTMDGLMEKFRIKHLDFLVMNCEGGEYAAFETTDWLNVPDRILLQLHGNVPFDTREYRIKRRNIYLALEHNGFALTQGTIQVRHKGKINQFWERPTP